MLRRTAHHVFSSSRSLKTNAISSEKRYVRLSGPSSHATRADIELLLRRFNTAPQNLHRSKADVIRNNSIWIYDAGSPSSAQAAADILTGNICGMKLIRATPIDLARQRPITFRTSSIAPEVGDRQRALFISNLPIGCPPRVLWSFFADYAVTDVRLVHRSGRGYVIFRSSQDALRAFRERSNLSLHGKKRCIRLSTVE